MVELPFFSGTASSLALSDSLKLIKKFKNQNDKVAQSHGSHSLEKWSLARETFPEGDSLMITSHHITQVSLLFVL